MISAVSRKPSLSFSGPTGSTLPVVFSSTLPLHPDLAFSGGDELTFGMQKKNNNRRQFLQRIWPGKNSNARIGDQKGNALNGSQQTDNRFFQPLQHRISRGKFLRVTSAALLLTTLGYSCKKDEDIEPVRLNPLVQDPGNLNIKPDEITPGSLSDYLDWNNVSIQQRKDQTGYKPGVVIMVPIIVKKDIENAKTGTRGDQTIFWSGKEDKPITLVYETYTKKIAKEPNAPENIHLRSTTATAKFVEDENTKVPYLAITTDDGAPSKGSRVYITGGLQVIRAEGGDTGITDFQAYKPTPTNLEPQLNPTECDQGLPDSIIGHHCFQQTAPLSPEEAAFGIKRFRSLDNANPTLGLVAGSYLHTHHSYGPDRVDASQTDGVTYLNLPNQFGPDLKKEVTDILKAIRDKVEKEGIRDDVYEQYTIGASGIDKLISDFEKLNDNISPSNIKRQLCKNADINTEFYPRLLGAAYILSAFKFGQLAVNHFLGLDNTSHPTQSISEDMNQQQVDAARNFGFKLRKREQTTDTVIKNKLSNNIMTVGTISGEQQPTLFLNLNDPPPPQGIPANTYAPGVSINHLTMPLLAELLGHEPGHKDTNVGIPEEAALNALQYTGRILIESALDGKNGHPDGNTASQRVGDSLYKVSNYRKGGYTSTVAFVNGHNIDETTGKPYTVSMFSDTSPLIPDAKNPAAYTDTPNFYKFIKKLYAGVTEASTPLSPWVKTATDVLSNPTLSFTSPNPNLNVGSYDQDFLRNAFDKKQILPNKIVADYLGLKGIYYSTSAQFP